MEKEIVELYVGASSCAVSYYIYYCNIDAGTVTQGLNFDKMMVIKNTYLHYVMYYFSVICILQLTDH